MLGLHCCFSGLFHLHHCRTTVLIYRGCFPFLRLSQVVCSSFRTLCFSYTAAYVSVLYLCIGSVSSPSNIVASGLFFLLLALDAIYQRALFYAFSTIRVGGLYVMPCIGDEVQEDVIHFGGKSLKISIFWDHFWTP